MKIGGFVGVVIVLEAVTAMVWAAVIVVRPDVCAQSDRAYLLAMNARAVISVYEHEGAQTGNAVVVFRPRTEDGWASQRILSRFDLVVDLDHRPTVVRNSGAVCPAPKS